MAELIERFGPIKPVEKQTDIFTELIDTIIYQQLATKAASTISKRFWEAFGDLNPSEIANSPDEDFRRQGISRQKLVYIKGIAKAVDNGSLHINMFDQMSDEEVIEELVKLIGIGRWSADMFLMFTLARPDIFAMGDLGLLTAVAKLYKVDRDDLDKIAEISSIWAPYRSTASRYLWRSLDNA